MSDHDDDLLLGELRAAASRLDPLPDDVVAGARSAFIWRDIDAELAELTAVTADEGAGSMVGTGVRGGAPTLLSFESGSLGIELEVLDEGDGRRVLGQLDPPRGGRVDVRHRGGSVEATVDDRGRFSVHGLAAGPVSLRFRASDGAPVDTDWFLA